MMSSAQAIASMVSEADVSTSSAEKNSKLIESGVVEVTALLGVTQDSMKSICRNVEAASTRGELKEAFKRLNGVWGIFLGLELPPESEPMLVGAISRLDPGARLSSFLATATSASCALSDYKASIMSELAAVIRKRVDKRRIVDEMDEALFSRFLPEPSPPCNEPVWKASDTIVAPQQSQTQTGTGK